MKTVTSKDGTKIAYKVEGAGPAIVLVDGAMSWTAFGDSHTIFPELAKQFTVYAYNRRGRGESGNTEPYAIDREIEDLTAVLKVAGSDANVCGFSSGAALAFYAAVAGVKMNRLVLYEAPFTVVDADDARPPANAVADLDKLVAEGKRKEVLDYFTVRIIGMPKFLVAILNFFNKKNAALVETVAHTLPYDIRILDQTKFETPRDAAKKVTVDTVVMYGDKTSKSLKKASEALAAAIPNAELKVVLKSSHMVNAKVLVPALSDILKNNR